MPRAPAKKKDPDAEVPTLPLKDPVAAAATDHPLPEHEDAGEAKAQKVLDEIRDRSSEIVIRQSFAKAAKIHTTAGLSQFLDDTLGLDGWQVAYRPFGTDGVCCVLSVRVISGLGTRTIVAKEGVGFPASDAGAGPFTVRMRSALQDSLFAAAAEFGINRAARAITDNDLAKPMAAAAKPQPAPASPPPPKKKTELEEKAEILGDWVGRLTRCDTPEQVNDLIRSKDFAAVPQFAKAEVWDLIKRTCCEEPTPGWKYDRGTKKFYAPEPEPEPDDNAAIPF